MKVSKRNVSLPSELDARLVAHVAGGNVSGFVAEAVREKLDRERDLAALAALWGPPEPENYEQALQSIRRTRPARPRTLPTT